MDITLVHAGLAAGAALAAVPVILHLFMKQTPKHVIFPALRLIRERHKRSRKKLKVKNWLLLLARMAVLALMALALARPALNSQASLGDREVPTALALVFDTSLSMEYTERNTTRLAEARRRADEILRKTPASSQVYVVDSAEPGAPVPMSPSAARKRIDGLALRPANRPLNEALGQAYRAVAQSDRPRREVYVLTDLARTSWDTGRQVEGLDAAPKAKRNVSTYVMRLTPKEVRDAAVVDAQPSATVAPQGEPIEVKATLRASGPSKDRVVEFYVDKDEQGRPIKRDHKTVQLPADGQLDVTFRTPVNLPVGLHQGEVRLAGGPDPMPFDDRRHFTLQVRPAQRILVVADRSIDGLFVTEALDPTKLRSGASRPFRVDRATSPELTEKLKESGKDYTCVFLLNVAQLSDADWGRLYGFVREGGGLVIAPGDKASPENYNSKGAAQVVPALLKEPVRTKESFAFGKATDDTHPLFSRYAKDIAAELSGIPVYRYWAIEPAQDARTLLAYQDGAPALVERTTKGPKTGRVLLWTTPLSRRPEPDEPGAWNEFPHPQFWSFLYLVNQTIPYLAGDAGERLNYEAGENVYIPVDPSRRFASYTVQGPDNKVIARLSPQVSNPTLVIQTPQAVGHWTVTGSGPGTSPQTLGFSVNPPEAEARVASLKPSDLDSLFGKDNYALADDTESLKRVVEKGRVGREMFPWIMALILALVTAENYLANRFHRERATA